MKISTVLESIGELGFVEIQRQGDIHITPPSINLHTSRLEIFAKTVFEYKKRNPDAVFKGFFTLYDAWREHAEPCEQPELFKLDKKALKYFAGRGTLGEPGRFIQPFFLKDLLPVLDYPVLSFGRHKNDPFVQLLPDTDFVSTSGYLELRKEIADVDIAWDAKLPKLFWRGSRHGFPYKQYDPMQLYAQRELLLAWADANNDICDAMSAKDSSKAEQLRYRYLLDVDGEVNAWSGLFWKLLSNSVVFKVNSHYEQWYYDRLKPWVHFIPVAGDLSDLKEKFEWATANDGFCFEIAATGKELARSMTFENEFNILNLHNNTNPLLKSLSTVKKSKIAVPGKVELTVVHTYQPVSSTVKQPPGFGDFLRGSIALYQLSKKYGFNLSIDFSSHPLAQHIMTADHQSYSNLPVYEFFNQKNCALESFLVGQSELRNIRLTTHAVPQLPVSYECRRFVLKHIKPSRETARYVSSALRGLDLKEFATVHIRMGDHQFENQVNLPEDLERSFVERIIPVWGSDVFVVSDNRSVKDALKSRFDIKIMDLKPVHSGEAGQKGASKEEVRDTFAEFLMMAKSEWIFQYSVYPWGSSFSEICARLYDIPLEKLR